MGFLLAQEVEDMTSDREGSVMACGAFSTEMGQQKAGRTHVPHLLPLMEKDLEPREQGETSQ